MSKSRPKEDGKDRVIEAATALERLVWTVVVPRLLALGEDKLAAELDKTAARLNYHLSWLTPGEARS